MDFGKALKPKCHDFDLNIPYLEDSNSNAENQFSSLIHNNSPQNSTQDMNITAANNGSGRVSDDNVRQVQVQVVQPTTYIDSLCVAGYRGITMGGRRRYRRRGQVHPIDPFRFCTNYHCRTRKTPLWRKGPLGPKTLCNACGIYYMKQVTRRGSGIPAPAVPVRGDASASASSSTSVPPATVQGDSSNF